ncbi:hypothetical protein HY025_04660 [Candidatus Daviesbacteria bacterium]|nr:hypothetical protein [Candidatus Daviesbacteria bacterium]
MAKKEVLPRANQIVLATNFLYRDYAPLVGERQIDDTDGIRGDLALIAIANATSLGVRVVAADGGSAPSFLSALERFKDGGLTVVTSDIAGRGPQRRRAFEVAAELPDVKVIGYFQAEKDLSRFLAKITRPFWGERVDLVIPSREPVLFKQHFPDYMRESELQVNATYDWMMKRAELMGEDQSFDWFFGPVFFRNDPEIVALFLKKYEMYSPVKSRVGAKPNPEMHSDGHYFPIIQALFDKKKVEGVEIPFVYPPTQRANEMSSAKIATFRERRRKDAAAYRLEALHFLEYLKGNPKSKIKVA